MATTHTQGLPATHRALVLTSTSSPPTVQVVTTPQPCPGAAILKILTANIGPYSGSIYNGSRGYAFPTPLVIGTLAIGRIAALGPDATSLSTGQLVLFDVFIKGRDGPEHAMLSGVHEGYTAGSKNLMHGEWRDSTYAQYAKVPLENCHVLDEKVLLGSPSEGGLGYNFSDLGFISRMLIPWGGLRDLALKPGETIIIAPATGTFGGGAVMVALALGVKVIAMGRNVAALEKVKALNPARVKTVPITNDLHTDMEALQAAAGGPGRVDAFFDISPPMAVNSTHLKAAILSLRHTGRVSLMGGIREDVALPHGFIMHKDISLKGRWMYPREAVPELIRMIEMGILPLGERAEMKVIGKYGLEQWEEGFKVAEECGSRGGGEQVVFCPWGFDEKGLRK